MCTLSVLLQPQGFLVAMNRDERRSRPLGGALRLLEEGGRRVAHPTDVEAGGTWFGASSAGFVAAVLNNYAADDANAIRPLSRGAIPATLLAASGPTEALATLDALDAGQYRPFRAVLVIPGEGVWVHVSDGARVTEAEHPWADLLLVSSGLDEPRVRAHRLGLFDALRAAEPGREALRSLHFQQNPAQLELGFSMERPEARSVSYTELEVVGGRWVLRHLEEPPIGYDEARRAALERSAITLREP